MLKYSHGNTPIHLSTPNLRCAAAAWLLTVAASMSSQQMPPAAATNTTQSIPKYEIVVFKDVMVPMRDGVRLACNIYRPALNGKQSRGSFQSSWNALPTARMPTSTGQRFSCRWATSQFGKMSVADSIRKVHGDSSATIAMMATTLPNGLASSLGPMEE